MSEEYTDNGMEKSRKNNELLNDIMLNVQVEIGRAKIKISELVNLANGSIIQLEQEPLEPLIIYANDKPVLKGQIISTNGKYHIRIL
jgi:flagellar motor switch protein FliN